MELPMAKAVVTHIFIRTFAIALATKGGGKWLKL